jgi:hypothetical protein
MAFGRHKGLERGPMFAELRRRGVAKVVVEFSGGGDEGGVNDITLYNADGGEIGKLEEDYGGSTYNSKTGQWEPINPPNPDTKLVEALVAPVYDRYGSFAGEFYVSGTVEYDVANEKVKMPYRESVETWEDHEEDL